MKFFKTPDGQVWAFEADGSQDALIEAAIAEGGIAMTDAEIAAHCNPPETRDQAVTRARYSLRTLYAPMLDKLDYMQLSYLTTGAISDAAAVETFKAGLRALMKSTFDGLNTYAEMKAYATAQYAPLVQAAPAGVVTKFRDLMTDDAPL